jgi:Dyp-type peroxidase family
VTTRTAPFGDEVLSDIQGFITSGYGHLPHAAYLFLQFQQAALARQWLSLATPAIMSARSWPIESNGKKHKPPLALNIAFTADGLAALGLPPEVLCTFPSEFQEGITRPDRSRVLGDTEESDPAQWELGGTGTPPIHAVLFIYAESATALAAASRAQRTLIEDAQGGVVELPGSMQSGHRPDDNREPFGFHDGIAQPAIAGIPGDGVPTGEFILGYRNHFQIMPPTPVVPAALDRDGILSALENPYHADRPLRDLGRNGSYVVYRKLEQDVASFWQFMKREAARSAGTANADDMIWLASRCVGRWPSGAPLALTPDVDDPTSGDRDDFVYGGDTEGLACPFGSHIRRTNPRDVIKPYAAAQSLSMSEAHRLLRRARAFGPALFDASILSDAAKPEGRRRLMELADDGKVRGIHFFCVNASIKTQFEFVQQTWCNNPRFAGLNDNKDPIIGDNARTDQTSSHMTIPRRPLRVRTAALPRFVKVRAGAYLFMPSLTALRFLAAS